MSRSYRLPYHHLACTTRESVKKWKRHSSSQFRKYVKSSEDPLTPSYHRKFIHQWSHPGDGRIKSDDARWIRK